MGKVVGKVLKGVAIVASIAAAAVTMGASLGVSAALLSGVSLVAATGAGLLQGSPKIPQSETHLGRLQARLDPQTPRKLVLGPRTAMPADIRYYEGSGEDEEYVDYILAVAAHRVGSIDEIWFEDQLAWTASGGVQGEYVGYLTAVTTRLEGTAANTVAINGGTRWGSDDRLTGCAYVRLRIKRTGNTDEAQSPLASGLPGRVTIIGEGMPEYDPRFDSTRGGVGSHRVDDQSTWGPSSGNPIIQSLNVLLGWRINGKLSVGAGLPVKYLNLDSAITAANMCDEDIAMAAGGWQDRYRTAGAFSTDDAPMEIVGALLAGCAGDLLDSDGALSFLIKANTLATPAVELDDHDVLSAATWDPMGGQTNLPNIISGSYTDPSSESLYQMVPYPSVSLPSEDGIERSAPVDFGVVEDPARAERLAKQTLQRMQYPGTFSAEYGMKAMAAKVGSIVHQTYSPLGWIAKPFRVVRQKPSRSGRIALVLREEHEDIYAWEAEDSASVQPAEPVRFDPRNTGPILLARRASETAKWSKVVDDGGKPEDNATEGATVPDPDGIGGNLKGANGDSLPPGLVRNDLFHLTPDGILGFRPITGGALQEVGRVDIVDLGGAEKAVVNKAKAAADRLAEAAIRLAAAQSTTRENMRDAGIYVDPDTGEVRISAVEQTDERLSEAEVRVSAAEAAITLRATTTYVDDKIAQAVLDPSQIADLEDLQVRIGAAEVAIDGNTAAISSKADYLELTAVEGRVTTAEQEISALEGSISTKVETVTFNSLETRVSTAEQEISAITGEAAGITQLFRVARVIEREVDANARTTLEALLDADRERRDRVAVVAELRQEYTARIISDVSAEAVARQSLAARVSTAEAGLLSESTARVNGDTALSQQLTVLTAEVDDNAAAIQAEQTARTDGDSSLATSINSVSAVANAKNRTYQQTTAPSAQAVGDLWIDTSNSRAVKRWNGSSWVAADDARIAQNAAAIQTEQTARADGDSALAQNIQTVSTEVDGLSSSVTTLSQAVDGVEAKYGVRLDVNGRVTGFVQNNDGAQGTFAVLADYFGVIDPDGGMGLTWQDGLLWNRGATHSALLGQNFGASNDLMFWIGPNPATPAQASKANGVFWVDANGIAYFGGVTANDDYVQRNWSRSFPDYSTMPSSFTQVSSILTVFVPNGVSAVELNTDIRADNYGNSVSCTYETKWQYSADKQSWSDVAGTLNTLTVGAGGIVSGQEAAGSKTGLSSASSAHFRLVSRMTSGSWAGATSPPWILGLSGTAVASAAGI